MGQIVQQPYNLFAMQKMAGYPSSGQIQQEQERQIPGQLHGETVGQFAAGKQAANSQTGAVSQPVVEQKLAPVVQQPQVQKQQTQPVLDSNSSSAGMDYLNSLYTDPKEEERLRKASVMNQRILAIGDAIRHIGNIANTVNYAPAQQLNSPVQEEYARYQQGKALRDRANQQFYTYQQQKAAQDAKAKQWAVEQERKQREADRTYNFNLWKYGNDFAEKQRQYDQNYKFNEQKHKDEVAYKTAAQKEAARHNRALESNSRAGLAETIRHHKEIEARGGSSSGNFPVKSPYGKMHVPGRSIPQAQMNQAYKDFENAGWIKKGEFAKRMRELGIGAQADPDYVRNRIVEEIIAENGMASDYMRDNFNWQYENDTRGTGEMLMRQSQPQTLFSAPWSSNLGNPFEDRQQPKSSNNHKSNPFG